VKVLGEEGIFLEHQELNLCVSLYFCFVGTGIGEENSFCEFCRLLKECFFSFLEGGGFGGDSHSVETKCEEKVLVGVAMKLLILCLWFVSV